MRRGLRTLTLAVHLTFSVGWIGAAAGYLALGLAATRGRQEQTVRAAMIAMELLGWYVIVPLAVGSLLTGILLALGSRWGLFRHYWVLVAFALTSFALVILLLHMPDVSRQADLARRSSGEGLRALGGDLFHSSLGLVVLLAIQVLNVYKPPGLTPYGWRRQRAL